MYFSEHRVNTCVYSCRKQNALLMNVRVHVRSRPFHWPYVELNAVHVAVVDDPPAA